MNLVEACFGLEYRRIMPFFVLIFFMNILYAGTPTFMKMASQELSPFQIVYLRHTLAMFAFLPFVLMSERKILQRRDFFRILLGAFLAFTFASVFQIIGVKLSQAADGSFIMAMEPVIVILFAYFFLKERLDSKMAKGLTLALGGFAVLSSQSMQPSQLFNSHSIGNLLFLLAVCGEASFPIILKPLLKRYPPHVVAFYCLLCASFYMLPFQGVQLWDTLPKLHAATWASIAYLGLGCSFLACFLWLTCLKRFSVSMVAVSWFLQPVMGCLFAFILLQEPITPQIWMGGSFIIMALAMLSPKEEAPAEAPVKRVPQAVTVLRIQHPLLAAKPTTSLRKTRLDQWKKLRKQREKILPPFVHAHHQPHFHGNHTYH